MTVTEQEPTTTVTDEEHPLTKGDVEKYQDETMNQWKAGTDLVERPERLPDMDAWARMEAMADRLANSKLMPKHIRDSRDPEADLMVILLTAHDLGLSATVAINKVNVIDGKPAMAAELMRMLVRRDDHEMWVEIERDEQGRAQAAVAYGIRKERPERTLDARFSIEDAVDADLCKINDVGEIRARSSSGKKLPWEAYTEDMLTARATSRLCRRVFEDCLAGVSYTPEELGVIEVEQDEVPVIPAADNVVTALREQISALTDDEKAAVRTAWNDARLGSLIPGAQHPLAADDVAHALALIAIVKRDTPAEAEVVPRDAFGQLWNRGPVDHPFEGPEGSDECATCGEPREVALHTAPTSPGADSVGEEGEHAGDEPATAEQPLSAPEPQSLDEWVTKLSVAKLREVMILSGLSIDGTDRALRTRFREFMAGVISGTVADPHACEQCHGYKWLIPPGFDACECAF